MISIARSSVTGEAISLRLFFFDLGWGCGNGSDGEHPDCGGNGNLAVDKHVDPLGVRLGVQFQGTGTGGRAPNRTSEHDACIE